MYPLFYWILLQTMLSLQIQIVFMNEASLQLVPVTVNVTLASDGIGGEGTVLTLVQLPPIESERVFANPTVRIIVEDNDSREKWMLVLHCDNAHTYYNLIHNPINTVSYVSDWRK